jgi:hypothetical protein
LYEGGIRVPGILEWPARIKHHAETWHPAYVSDYLPTLLDILGMQHPQPDWAADGISLLPLITTLGVNGTRLADRSLRPSQHPLWFQLGTQAALIDNAWKLLENPKNGVCPRANGSAVKSKSIALYNLDADPTESVDLSTDPAHAELFRNLSARLDAFQQSVSWSAVHESQCAEPVVLANAGASAAASRMPATTRIQPACISPLAHPPHPHPSPSPSPPVPPPRGPIGLFRNSVLNQCITVRDKTSRAAVSVNACDAKNPLQLWQTVTPTGEVFFFGGASVYGARFRQKSTLKANIGPTPVRVK